jgi:hypothetical protein
MSGGQPRSVSSIRPCRSARRSHASARARLGAKPAASRRSRRQATTPAAKRSRWRAVFSLISRWYRPHLVLLPANAGSTGRPPRRKRHEPTAYASPTTTTVGAHEESRVASSASAPGARRLERSFAVVRPTGFLRAVGKDSASADTNTSCELPKDVPNQLSGGLSRRRAPASPPAWRGSSFSAEESISARP